MKTSRWWLPLLLVALVCVTADVRAQGYGSPVQQQHLEQVMRLFAANGLRQGGVSLDRYGRIELKGTYEDEREVDRAFSLAQTVVGVRWVSPVTPENIKVHEWERRLGSLFSRANVLQPA